MLISSKIEL